MFYRDMDGFLGLSIFDVKKEDFDKRGGMQLQAECYNLDSLIERLGLNIIDVKWQGTELESHYGVEDTDEEFKVACERTVLEFCLTLTNFAKDVLTEEDYTKALAHFQRKQFNSKILKTLLARFQFMAELSKTNAAILSSFFAIRVEILRQEIVEDSVSRSFAPLKKVIEQTAGGVKSECYIQARTFGGTLKLPEECNEYLKAEFGYDFNRSSQSGYSLIMPADPRGDYLLAILNRVILDDERFWEQHGKFNILHFIEIVYKNNGAIHANKILKYMFGRILSCNEGKAVVKNNLPLECVNFKCFIDGLEELTFTRLFKRFEAKFWFSKIEGVKLCYPISEIENVEVKISEGKRLVEELFNNVYGENSIKAVEFLNKQLKNSASLYEDSKHTYTVLDLFELYTFEFKRPYIDDAVVNAMCPDYFGADNVWNRFYIKAYELFELAGKKELFFACMFEVYFDMFRVLNDKLGLNTSYQLDTSSRDKIYDGLKAILDGYDIKVSDGHKSEYITSLLDRKVALIEEIERFPVLEQLGDAVYGLAVAEMLFYNPDTDERVAISLESFINATAQIEVAEKIGIDKLYFSSFTAKGKYDSNDITIPTRDKFAQAQERESFSEKKKFIADSLEMIIGAICNEHGYRVAIDFVKRIVRETFRAKNPNYFPEELHWMGEPSVNIDRAYWTRILPAPYAVFNAHHKMLWGAFNKFFLAFNVGTEDALARVLITNSNDGLCYDLNSGADSENSVNKVFYCYLQNGLEATVEKYGKAVKKSFYETFN